MIIIFECFSSIQDNVFSGPLMAKPIRHCLFNNNWVLKRVAIGLSDTSMFNFLLFLIIGKVMKIIYPYYFHKSEINCLKVCTVYSPLYWMKRQANAWTTRESNIEGSWNCTTKQMSKCNVSKMLLYVRLFLNSLPVEPTSSCFYQSLIVARTYSCIHVWEREILIVISALCIFIYDL